MKSLFVAASLATALLVPVVQPAFAQQKVPSVASEAKAHPRIAIAIREIEDAIRYMEAAPHDFGGNKAKAIADSKVAVASLRQALAYRATVDAKKK